MKANMETIILTERAADHGRLRAVLRDWGYEENEIHRVLKEQRGDLNNYCQKDSSVQRAPVSELAMLG